MVPMVARLRILVILACVALLAPAGTAPATEAPGERELLVGFHALPPELLPGGEYAGAEVKRVLPEIGAAVVRSSDPAGFLAGVRLDPAIRYVEENVEVRADVFTPNDPRYPNQYGPQQVGAPAAWDSLLGGAVRDVCIVDTGLRTTHEDLRHAYVGGFDFVNLDADPRDDHGHGTHVAGIAAAGVNNGVGIAGIANVNLLVAKVLNETGYGTLDAVLAGILWCVAAGGDVVSMSLGTNASVVAFHETLQYAHSHGALLVAAAGNDACDGCAYYPAAYPEVIAVGCVESDNTLCSFSNRADWVELAAPGRRVLSTWDTADDAYAKRSGTSMSTPHVTGVAALVWNAAPHLSADEVRTILRDTAKDLGADGCDASYGHGLVDAGAAVDAAIGRAAAPVPLDLPHLLPTQGCVA